MDASSQSSPAQPVVYVGNLSIKTTPQELQSLFSKEAPVVKLTLRSKADKASAFAFVTFPNADSCEKIVQKYNFYMLHNKQMNIDFCTAGRSGSDEANIFVKNLPPNLNSKDLYEIFKMFGQIVSCKVASDASGQLKGFGYVQYKTAKAAKKAIATCQNVKIGAHTLDVRAYDSKVKEARTAKAAPVATFTNCYVKNFPASLKEAELLAVLEKCGRISSLYFPVREDGSAVGYACANFETPEAASEAIAKLHNKDVFPSVAYGAEDGIDALPFYIQRAEDKKDRTANIKRQMETLSFDGQIPKCNLYISNIPDSFSYDEIKSIFKKYGKIVSFKIAPVGGDIQKQYGYICYSTPEEAAIAYEKIDGTFLDGSKLQISYYKTKAERIYEADAFAAGSGKRQTWVDSQNFKVDAPTRKALNAIFDLARAEAPTYSTSWDLFEAKDAAEFAQKIVLALVSFPAGQLTEMANDKTLLNSFITRTIKDLSEASAKNTTL